MTLSDNQKCLLIKVYCISNQGVKKFALKWTFSQENYNISINVSLNISFFPFFYWSFFPFGREASRLWGKIKCIFTFSLDSSVRVKNNKDCESIISLDQVNESIESKCWKCKMVEQL